jgi:hypothetical protein
MTNSSNILFDEITLTLVTAKFHKINTVMYIVGSSIGWGGMD